MAQRISIAQRCVRVQTEVARLYPDAHCELNFKSDLELLIAIALSAQTTDESVNKTTATLFPKYPTLNHYLAASEDELAEAIRHLGLYRNKAKHLKAMTTQLAEVFGGRVPATQAELESLPGVGRKTANVFLAVWHHIPRIAVDTHVERVSKRLGLVKEDASVTVVETTLMRRFPKTDWIALHHQLLFFGRYFCTAKRPNCLQCPLRDICLKPLC
ncbi:MAG: endonuclease III [Bacillus subtilis]|nr:endonuclease III [Bacillus subtilis]